MNLIQGFEATLESVGLGDRASVVPLREAGTSDLAVVVQNRVDLSQAAEALSAHPQVASVRRAGKRLLLRVENDCIEELGRRLEAGGGAGMGLADLLAGRRYVVEFCDPNATKALHIGHLRNIALGHGFACALEAAGAQVERQSQISDAGQQIGEAMAGYHRFGDGSTPARASMKGDRFVGELYSRYVQSNLVGEPEVASHDLPVAREISDRGDFASELLSRWQEGDPDTLSLWSTIRDWALAGQEETLARLGVRVDRPLLESAYLPLVPKFVEAALAVGVASYADNGALIHETGRAEYPAFPLTRPDGFPTLNLRALTVWNELVEELQDIEVIHVCGDEWREHTVCVGEILKRMHPGKPPMPTHDVVHGMVLTEGGVMSSSEGRVILIDDLLEDLAASPQVRGLETESGYVAEAEDLACIVVLGYCLNTPAAKPLIASLAAMTGERSAGMLLARAWGKACAPVHDAAEPGRVADADYRFVVVQAQAYKRILAKSLEDLDLLPSVRFLGYLSDWYVGRSASPGVTRVIKAFLGAGLGSLGILRRSARDSVTVSASEVAG